MVIGFNKVLSPFQNVGHFDFFRFIYFAMYMNLKKSKRPIFWNGGSNTSVNQASILTIRGDIENFHQQM